jgi:hypothetical protein
MSAAAFCQTIPGVTAAKDFPHEQGTIHRGS